MWYAGTDSTAAQRIGEMRHEEIRGICLQTELREGTMSVHKAPEEENTAAFMAKFLGIGEIESRLKGTNAMMEMRSLWDILVEDAMFLGSVPRARPHVVETARNLSALTPSASLCGTQPVTPTMLEAKAFEATRGASAK